MPMPAAITLTPDEQKQLVDLTAKATSGVIQYGVPRGGIDDSVKPAVLADPKLLVALAQSSSRDAQVAAVQAMFDLQVEGDKPLDLSGVPEWKPVVYALMTGKDLAVAASATQSAMGGPRDEKADPDIQKLLERMCTDDQRVQVRAAACSGVIFHVNTKFMGDKDAQAVIDQALTDEEPYVVFRTLDDLGSFTFDAKYQEHVLALLKSSDPVIRGLAITVAARTLSSGDQDDPAAITKAHDAGIDLLKDSSGYVRCEAAFGLNGYQMRNKWDMVDPMLALVDDKAESDADFKYQQLSLTDPPKDDTWSEHGSYTVGECMLRALLIKSESAMVGDTDVSLKFDDFDHVMDAGRKAFTTWWTANKAKLTAPPAAPGSGSSSSSSATP
jgi:hypothetical protein